MAFYTRWLTYTRLQNLQKYDDWRIWTTKHSKLLLLRCCFCYSCSMFLSPHVHIPFYFWTLLTVVGRVVGLHTCTATHRHAMWLACIRKLPGSFLIEPLDWEESVARLHDYGSNHEIQIDLAETPFFTIWSDLHPFICVEPCWGLPDHHQQRPFEKKLGIQVVPPQATLSRSCSIRFR